MTDSSSPSLGIFVLIATIILLAMGLRTQACTDADHTRSVLERAGYTDIQPGDFTFLKCSNSDTYATEFQARGPSGLHVSGAVCCGFFKNCTIRLD